MSAGRIIAVIIGALLALLGLGGVVAGAGLVVVHATQRDDGYYQTPTERFETPTSALVAYAELPGPGWTDNPVGTIRVQATPADTEPVFVGIGPRDEVEAWLAGTEHERIVNVRYLPFRTETERISGAGSVTPPEQQDFWVASASGGGTQTLTWRSQEGSWALVVMNADAQPDVATDVDAGVASRVLLPAGIVVGVVGLLLLAGGLAIMLVAVATGRRAAEPTPAGGGSGHEGGAGAGPPSGGGAGSAGGARGGGGGP
jgi:hypothetical protein